MSGGGEQGCERRDQAVGRGRVNGKVAGRDGPFRTVSEHLIRPVACTASSSRSIRRALEWRPAQCWPGPARWARAQRPPCLYPFPQLNRPLNDVWSTSRCRGGFRRVLGVQSACLEVVAKMGAMTFVSTGTSFVVAARVQGPRSGSKLGRWAGVSRGCYFLFSGLGVRAIVAVEFPK